MVVVVYPKPPTLKFTYLFFFIVVVCVSGTTPLSIVLGHKTTVSKPTICHIKDSESTAIHEAEDVIINFLTNGNRNDCDNHEFHIHGWKWHTMSLVHEARRLRHIAATLHDRHQRNPMQDEEMSDTTDVLALRTVADYTVDFNMRGLHRIENEVFFPVLRQRISSSSTAKILGNDKEVVTAAITTVLNQLDKDRKGVELLGTSLVRRAAQTLCMEFSIFSLLTHFISNFDFGYYLLDERSFDCG